jgi:hypothetical protein
MKQDKSNTMNHIPLQRIFSAVVVALGMFSVSLGELSRGGTVECPRGLTAMMMVNKDDL